jgi:predicted permease
MPDSIQPPRFWLWLIRVIGVIVPRRLRSDWRQEWEAELRHRELLLEDWDKLNWKTRFDLLRRSLGAFWDALLLQPQRLEDEMFQDLRYGARMLMKNPGFTLIAVFTLSLGIGANTAIFSVLYGVLLKPLPYPNPDPIVRVWQSTPASGFAHLGMSEAQLVRLNAGNESFGEIGGYAFRRITLSDQAESQRLAVGRITSGVFGALGVQPAFGRAFSKEDELPGAERVAILSDNLWQHQFGAKKSILGQTIRLDDNPVTVIGVMPADFRLPEDLSIPQGAQLWLPVRIDPSNLNWGSYYLSPVARLKPGVQPEQALTEVSAIFAQLRQQHPQGALNDPAYSIRVLPLHDDLVGNVRTALLVLVGAVAVVLLIACANVSSLLLARAAGRRKEIAVRVALGAARGRIVRQLLTESMLISLMGGATGVMLAGLGVKLISTTTLISVPRLGEITLNLTVLLFTLGVCLASAILFGLAPAAQVSRLDLNRSLREEGHGLVGNARGNRVHRVLVVSEIALAVVLVIAAGLLLRSFDRLLRIDPGFDVKNLLTVAVSLPSSRYRENTQVTAFYNQVLERVRGLPGVMSAAATTGVPLTDASDDTVFQIEGRPDTGVIDLVTPPDRNAFGHIYYWHVTPNYFETMGIPLRHGRTLQDSDGANSPPVVVINETMAGSFWPNETPLGKRIRLSISASQRGPWAEIIGIVRDVPLRQLNEEAQPEAYLTTPQGPLIDGVTARGMTLTARTSGDPLALAEEVRREVRGLDSAAPISFVGTVEQALGQTVAQPRFNLILLGLFAVVALLLAAVGIYGILANAVRQRTHEIGIRLALGARPSTVFRLIVGQGMGLATIGVGLGLGGALVITRYLESLLYEVKPVDPLTFGGVAGLLLSVALLACYLPARRATRVDPLDALRQE